MKATTFLTGVGQVEGIDLGLILIVVLLVAAVLMVFYLVPLRLYIAAASSGAPVSILSLIAMRLRRVPPAAIVNPLISATKAGLEPMARDLKRTAEATSSGW
jgi:uncharacterized protein YqfA (UPF0365 family)